MYYVVYGLLYTFSLLPLRVLYLFSDLAYFILYYIVGYRKDVIMSNLNIAFPEKSEKEKKQIAKKFCRNFTDTFIETIKMISISKKEVQRRGKVEYEYINELIDQGKNIHIMASHQFNWEFANLAYAMNLKIPFAGVYMPVNNPIFDRIFYKFREQYGTILISAKDFRNSMHNVFKSQYILALAADQNPGNAPNAYWLDFFGKKAPFAKGPAKGAVKYNTAIVFVAFEKVKRGYYKFRITPLIENGAEHTPEELTLKYRDILEDTIRRDPSNYLWSHRRWRHEWKPEYQTLD